MNIAGRGATKKRAHRIKVAGPPGGSLPYDSLVSNRGRDETSMYMQRVKGERRSWNFEADPMEINNSPSWVHKTIGEERESLFVPGHDKEDDYSRGGLTRDNRHSEFGGGNMFARVKKRRDDKAKGLGFFQRTKSERTRRVR